MSETPQNRNNIMRYAGLASTWLAMLLVTVWLGLKLDGWLKWKFPIFTILLPVVMLVYLLWKIIQEFSNPKK
jgi:hypothetical protein